MNPEPELLPCPKIPASKFNVGDEVLVRCDEAGCPPTFQAAIVESRYGKDGRHYYTVTENGKDRTSDYTDEWLSPVTRTHSQKTEELESQIEGLFTIQHLNEKKIEELQHEISGLKDANSGLYVESNQRMEKIASLERELEERVLHFEEQLRRSNWLQQEVERLNTEIAVAHDRMLKFEEQRNQLAKQNKVMVILVEGLMKDYGHPWPNEDADTTLHRRAMLALMKSVVDGKPSTTNPHVLTTEECRKVIEDKERIEWLEIHFRNFELGYGVPIREAIDAARCKKLEELK